MKFNMTLLAGVGSNFFPGLFIFNLFKHSAMSQKSFL